MDWYNYYRDTYGKENVCWESCNPSEVASAWQGSYPYTGGKVYISKEPMELNKEKFWTTIFCDNKIISKVELSNAEEKYKMNYQTMNDNILKELRKHNNDFLKNELGIPSNESITGIEYDYAWGKIFSYYDNKSSETGIVIVYI